MAGEDYQEWGLSIEEWELQESVVPHHLLDDDSEEEVELVLEGSEVEDDNCDRVVDGSSVKQAVTCDIRASVRKLIDQSISHIVVHFKQLKLLTLLLENFLFSQPCS
ncbi:unnamed protein product [Arabis nemorensis]|uniref:Uncharacterized protein n=1 Tax=Arabis nemorensis TaxID=586526 RepID=A0A565BR51_9BRAS|nr:unnamed protein product [Arabis nemorensis]